MTGAPAHVKLWKCVDVMADVVADYASSGLAWHPMPVKWIVMAISLPAVECESKLQD